MNLLDVVKALGWALNSKTRDSNLPLDYHYGNRDSDTDHAGFSCRFCKAPRQSNDKTFQHTEACPYAFAVSVLAEAQKEVSPSNTTAAT